jgi:RNA polymerase sigma-70 factor (ECF subfamily)
MERSEVVLQALQALGERQRTAIMLSKFEGMSYQEISDTMGLSVKAIKSLLSRARVNLKSLLDPYIATGVSPDSIASSAETNRAETNRDAAANSNARETEK